MKRIVIILGLLALGAGVVWFFYSGAWVWALLVLLGIGNPQ